MPLLPFSAKYIFPSDNRIVAVNLHLIVMTIKVDNKTFEMYNVICTAYTNLTDISITLTPHGKDRLYSKVSLPLILCLTTLIEISAMSRAQCGTN